MAAMPAAAQQAAAPDSNDQAEIVVTAQNRAENVQDVPIAINVISAEQVEKAGVTDFSGVERLAPTVQITNDTVLTRVTVRGVGTNDNAETQDQSIAVNIDGEYLNRPTVLNASLFDLERVEVLRGPQGTLYGRNATGGAINFITRKPGQDLALNGAVSYGNFNALLVQGGLDVPLGDIGGLRFAGSVSRRNGFLFHPNINARSGDDNTRAGRISLRLKPSSALTVDLSGELVRIDTIPMNQAFVNFNADGIGPTAAGCASPGGGWVEISPLSPGTQCIPANTNFLPGVNRSRYDAPLGGNNGLGFNRQESIALRGRVAYDLGAAMLTYTGGYRTTSQVGDTNLSPRYTFKGFQNDVDTQSHELRLNGTTGGIIWQLGGFHFRENLEIDRGLYSAPFNGYINYFSRPFVKTRSWAAFGQVDVPLTEQLTAVVGGRYTTDDRSAIFNNYGQIRPSPPIQISQTSRVPTTLRPDASANRFTWLVGLNYQPDADTLIYGKIATGFKAGGFDAVGEYRPETNTAYEGGVKKTFGEGGRHTFNLAGFYYDYRDLQAAVLLDSAIGGQVFNAGKARIWGLEAETSLKVLDSGRFTLSVNYLDAQYLDFLASYAVQCIGCPASPFPQNGLGDIDADPTRAPIVQPNLAGNRPPQSPRWVIAAGYEHGFDLGDAGTITASVFTRFKSAYFLDIFNYRDSRQDAFTSTDVSLEYQPAEAKWRLQAFVRSIENARPLTFAGFVSAGPDDIYNWQFGAPRTYGLRVSFDF
ncbi:TonB-dependent receptor [Novosphingobium piscinae]|nr:TonB-dependent receptor [Novosphingobium piscinae]